jgi:hypothetical protein
MLEVRKNQKHLESWGTRGGVGSPLPLPFSLNEENLFRSKEDSAIEIYYIGFMP